VLDPVVIEAVVDLVDLVGEQHDARLFDLVVGDVDVDAGEVADRQPVLADERAAQLDVEALVGEPGREHVGPERPGHAGQPGHGDHDPSV